MCSRIRPCFHQHKEATFELEANYKMNEYNALQDKLMLDFFFLNRDRKQHLQRLGLITIKKRKKRSNHHETNISQQFSQTPKTPVKIGKKQFLTRNLTQQNSPQKTSPKYLMTPPNQTEQTERKANFDDQRELQESTRTEKNQYIGVQNNLNEMENNEQLPEQQQQQKKSKKKIKNKLKESGEYNFLPLVETYKKTRENSPKQGDHILKLFNPDQRANSLQQNRNKIIQNTYESSSKQLQKGLASNIQQLQNSNKKKIRYDEELIRQNQKTRDILLQSANNHPINGNLSRNNNNFLDNSIYAKDFELKKLENKQKRLNITVSNERQIENKLYRGLAVQKKQQYNYSPKQKN